MTSRVVVAIVLLAACACNQIYGLDGTRVRDAPPALDAPPDAIGCSGIPFMAPMPVADVVAGKVETDPTLADEGRELYFTIPVGVDMQFRIHVATRASTAEPFANVTELPLLPNTPTTDPSLTRDSLTMLFVSRDVTKRVLETSRPSIDLPFAEPTLVDGLGAVDVFHVDVSYDGLRLYYSDLDGALWTASRAARGTPFAEPRMLATGINAPSISPDELELFSFDFDDAPGARVYRRVRATTDAPFSDPPTVILEDALHADLAQDGETLVLSSFGQLVTLSRQCP